MRAGVTSIEHGSFMDDEGAKMMAHRGTFFVPTMYAGETVEKAAKDGMLKGQRADKALAAAAAMRNAVKLAIANHVPLAMGTDAGVEPHGTNMREVELFVEWGGLTPLQSITIATMGSAKLLGWDKRIGSIEKGKLADIIAVPGDVASDIHKLEKVSFVMKNGTVYKQP